MENNENKLSFLSAKQISDIWYFKSVVIEKSRNCVIAKSLPDYSPHIQNPAVLKVINLFKSLENSRLELMQEIEIYRHFQKQTTNG